jgi:uncharacterized protein (TIGR02453 family)
VAGTTKAGRFAGFGPELVDFYEGLSADNSKTYWQAHKATYTTAVAEPLAALAEALAPEFGEVKTFRPYRDVRFSADKRPYQEHASLMAAGHAGAGSLYLQVSAEEVMLAGGLYRPPQPTLTAFREAVDDPATAASFDAVVATLDRRGVALMGDSLRSRPRGWPADHPRLDLLRLTNMAVARSVEVGEWIGGPGLLREVTATWRAIVPYNAWLAAHLGAAAHPAPRR